MSGRRYKRRIFLGIIIALIISFVFIVLTITSHKQDLQVRNDVYSVEREKNEGVWEAYNVTINYPQFDSTEEAGIDIDRVNALIKDAAFSMYGKTSADAITVLEEELRDSHSYEESFIDYDILQLDQEYISMVFTIDYCVGGPSYMQQYPVTIDIKKGEYIYLNDLADLNEVLNVLRSGNFEVYAGTYSEFTDEDAHGQEAIRCFTETFEEQIRKSVTEGSFDRFSSQNIGIDEQYIYIFFPLEEGISFHGYYILCVPRNLLENTTSTEIAETEQNTIASKYQILDTELLGGELPEITGSDLLESGTNEYLGRNTSSEEPVTTSGAGTDSDFPEELIRMTEMLLRASCNGDTEELETAYEELVNTYGAAKYAMDIEELCLLFPKLRDAQEPPANLEDAYRMLPELYLLPQHLIRIFRITGSDGQEQYVFEYGTGGSNGGDRVSVNDYIDGEFVPVSEFETQNEGMGRVIKYENAYYYTYLSCNYNLKEYDGVRLHKLDSQPETQNLLIRYLPKEYIWRRLYFNGGVTSEIRESIEEYLQKTGTEFMTAQYLDCGKGTVDEYYGDEKKAEKVLETGESVYMADIANCGLPVYMSKSEYEPSNMSMSEYLKIRFYYFDPEEDVFVKMENLSMEEYEPGIRLMQLWVKEFEDGIYTFRVYHVSDYSYLLNIIKLDEDRVTNIATYALLPEKEFVLAEGEVLNLDWY